MKFSLLLFIIYLVGISVCLNNEPNYYITFEPHLKPDCSDEISGIGYSGIINTCFTIDYITSFRFEIIEDSNDGEISIQTFNDQLCNYGDSNSNPILNLKTKVGSCIPAIEFNSNYEFEINNITSSSGNSTTTPGGMYYLVSIEKVIIPKDFIPSNSIVSTFSSSSGSSGKCSLKSSTQSPILIEFLTNNTMVFLGAPIDNSTYFCSGESNEPYYIECTSIMCFDPISYKKTCESIMQFYNGTSYMPIPTGTNTGGGFSTATSGHFSGNTIGSKHSPSSSSSGGAMNDKIESITYTSSQFSGNTIGNRPAIIDDNIESITYTSSQFSTDTIGNRPAIIDDSIESITYTSSQFSGNTIGSKPINDIIESITYSSSQFSGNTIGNRPIIDNSIESITYTSSQFSTDTIGSKPSDSTFTIKNDKQGGKADRSHSSDETVYYTSTFCSA